MDGMVGQARMIKLVRTLHTHEQPWMPHTTSRRLCTAHWIVVRRLLHSMKGDGLLAVMVAVVENDLVANRAVWALRCHMLCFNRRLGLHQTDHQR